MSVTYTVYFYSVSDAVRARALLERAGFAVADVAEGFAPIEAPHGLEAYSGAESEEAAAVALDGALADVPHDPVIHWHVAMFTRFTKPTRD